jgi:hypothetical protein
MNRKERRKAINPKTNKRKGGSRNTPHGHPSVSSLLSDGLGLLSDGYRDPHRMAAKKKPPGKQENMKTGKPTKGHRLAVLFVWFGRWTQTYPVRAFGGGVGLCVLTRNGVSAGGLWRGGERGFSMVDGEGKKRRENEKQSRRNPLREKTKKESGQGDGRSTSPETKRGEVPRTAHVLATGIHQRELGTFAMGTPDGRVSLVRLFSLLFLGG